ncbi:MAG: RNA polymerase sigma factor [bacterium]|nr:RNA polymerase sigma factor [bacterium]
MHRDDELLLERAKEDPGEFEKLYRKYRASVFNYLWYRVGHDKEAAEDLTQETFLRAFRSLSRFVHRKFSYLTYLVRIAHNLLIDHYRKPAAAKLEAAGEIPYEMLGDIERKSEAASLWRAVQELPKGNRDVLLMRYLDEMRIADIARVMGVTENAVKLNLSRTRKRLAGHRYLSALRRFGKAKRPYRAPSFLA